MPLGLLFVLVVAAFARLLFFSPEGHPYALIPWDFRSQYSAWLVFAGDALQRGQLPLWCPYASAGTPFFLNPQSQLWSPLTLLVGALLGYSQYGAQVQAVFLLFVAAAGAYALSFSLFGSRAGALVTAIGFGLTSQLFGHLEHMTSLNAGALLPWCFFAAALLPRSAWAAPLLAGLVALLVTTGYPATVLMILAWLAAFVLFLRGGLVSPQERARLLRRALLAGALALALSAVHWLPIALLRGEFTRGGSLALDKSLFDGNLSFRQLWSVLFQFMMVHALPGHESDVSVRGFYFGALSLPLGLAAALASRDRLVRALLLFTAATFLLACGGQFFGRTALHAAVPLFRFARFPGVDSGLLSVLGFTLLAGAGAALVAKGDAAARAALERGTRWTWVAVLLGLAALRAVYPVHTWGDVVLPWGTAELAFLGAALLALRIAEGRALQAALIAVLALELGTCVTANFHVAGQPIEAAAYEELLARHRREAPLEQALQPRSITGDPAGDDEYAAFAYVGKVFFVTEYNPLRLRAFLDLVKAGFAPWLTDGPRLTALPSGASFATPEALLELARPLRFTIESYDLNEVAYRVSLPARSLLVFNEVSFPGWRASVDGGTPVAMARAGPGLRALEVDAGEHRIETAFRPTPFYVGLGISLASLAFLAAWALRARRAGP